MNKRVAFLVLVIIFVMIDSNAFASGRPVLRYKAHEDEIKRMLLQDRKIQKVYGEIITVSPEIVELDCNGESHSYKLSPWAKIYCNGLPSVWNAVRPVCDRAYFEADVLLNESGEVLLMNASYYGEPLVIDGRDGEKGKLTLSVYIPDSGENENIMLADGARLPEGSDWLAEGQEIFVLYNNKLEIRAVFLPD